MTEAGGQIDEDKNYDGSFPKKWDPITPESNQAYLREHQAQLRHTFASCDLSEVSYRTEEQTDFHNSRHSSINTEPLTLDADQMHDAVDKAVDVLQKADPDEAFDIFTKGALNNIMGRVSMMEYFWRRDGQDFEGVGNEETITGETEAEVVSQQISSLVEKAQEVVEANEKQAQAVAKIPGSSTKNSALSGRDGMTEEKQAQPVEEVPGASSHVSVLSGRHGTKKKKHNQKKTD